MPLLHATEEQTSVSVFTVFRKTPNCVENGCWLAEGLITFPFNRHQHDFDESGLTYWIGTNAKMASGQSGPVRIGRRDFVGRPELSVRQIEGHPQPRRVGLTTLAATAGRRFATCSSKFQRMVFIRRRCILQSSVLASDRITCFSTVFRA